MLTGINSKITKITQVDNEILEKQRARKENFEYWGATPDQARKAAPEAIQELVDFDLLIAPDVKEMALPTEHDLMLLRTKCDPEGFFLKRKIVDK